MGAALALLAAVSFAVGTVLQQRGTLRTDAPEGDPRFLAQIVRDPVWLVGGLCQAIGWILQAVALADTSLVVVQSLCALSLVFALPLGVRLTGQVVGRRAVAGAIAATAGIVVFVAVGQPQGGVAQPSATAWWSATVGSLVVLVGLAVTARRRRGAVAAALLATAAGMAFAFQAAVTKVFVTVVDGGLSAVLASWTTYALVVSALGGFALQQSALKTGFLAPAMAASNATTLVVSVVLGVRVFDETLASQGSRNPAAIVGLVLAVAGVLLLASPEPGAAAVGTDRP